VQQARGDAPGALATVAELVEVARHRSFASHLRARAAAARAYLLLLKGDLDTAVQWAVTSGLNPDDALSYPRELEYLTLARVRIAQGRHDPAGMYLHAALHLLDRLLEAAEAGARTDSVIGILVLRALALRAQDDQQAALAALERALTLAAPEGYVRVFVDEGTPMAALLERMKDEGRRMKGDSAPTLAHVHTLLAAFPLSVHSEAAPAHAEVTPLHPSSLILHPSVADRLTERELEVLRLLAVGRSNQAIAEDLIVAVGTVKRHVSNIMSKLGVQSRLEAAARARELDVL
jgi:LuxR family maltose regulon positive regulatory protein